MMEASGPVVYLVDDNQPFRRSTALVLQTIGLEVRDFETGPALLARLAQAPVEPTGACVVSDVRMPDMSGLELLEELKRRKYDVPVIFITGHADVPLAVEAMRRGALNFIEKPFAPEVLTEAIRSATTETRPRENPDTAAVPGGPNPKLTKLTRRERQVLELVVAGKFNKIIADVLGISTKTVELHRASLMSKLEVHTLPDLVKLYLGHQ